MIALFFSSWCPFCRSFKIIFERYAYEREIERFILVRIDDYDNVIWNKFDVKNVPTVILFEKEKIIKRLDGSFGRGLTEQQFIEFLE